MGEKRNGVGSPHRTRILGVLVHKVPRHRSLLRARKLSREGDRRCGASELFQVREVRCDGPNRLREENTTSAFDKNINLRY